MNASSMLKAHPQSTEMDRGALAECIEACFDCEQTCTSCANACLAQEEMLPKLVRCIRLDLDCADVCAATGRILSRQTETDWQLVLVQLQALERAVKVCGDECQKHADRHEHCRICMESCRRCEESCKALMSQIRSLAAA